LTLSLAAGGSWADSVRVEAARVNVRKDPNTASAIVTTVGRGEALEVVERSGDWYHVKTAGGVEGYVSARLVAPVTPSGAAAPPARAATPAATAPAPAPSPWKGDRPVIVHQDVGCVVAGEFPKLEACFNPPESVGKAQVQFRADEKGPWYYVDMKEEGGCRSALLPKPKKDIGTFHYFIEVVDRSFTAVQKPEAAPSQSYAPRVVANRRDCGQGMMMATGTPTGSVVMGVARDAGGKVLQAAAAHSAETTASISGFSADGVSMASTGAAPGAAPAPGPRAPRSRPAASPPRRWSSPAVSWGRARSLPWPRAAGAEARGAAGLRDRAGAGAAAAPPRPAAGPRPTRSPGGGSATPRTAAA
jgi:hypothetical protein